MKWRYAAVAVLVAAYLYPFVRGFVDSPDFGVFLNGADLLNHGAIPSRDFVEPQGPGSFVWLAMFFRLFGTTLATARWLLIATGVGIALLTMQLARRLGASGLFATLFAVTISVALLPENSPHYDSNLFALASFAVFMVAWNRMVAGEQPRSWILVLAAVLCGAATWMIQQKGFFLAAALGVSIVGLLRTRATKPVMIFAGTYALVALLPFGMFAMVHALPDVWFANYVWPMTVYSDINAAPYGFPVWRDFQFSIVQTAFLMPYLLVAVLPLLLPVVAWWSGRRWFRAAMLPYWLAAYALWFAELHRVDMGHLRNGVVMMSILFFAICETGGNRFLRRTGLVLTLCATLVATINFRASWESAQQLETRRGGIRVSYKEPVFAFLKAHTLAGEEVFVYPYQPIFYFMEDLKNPTRYSYLLYRFNTESQFREAASDLERKKVRYVVFDKLLSGEALAQVFPAYRQPQNSELIMEPYLAAHYRVASDAGRFRVLERTE